MPTYRVVISATESARYRATVVAEDEDTAELLANLVDLRDLADLPAGVEAVEEEESDGQRYIESIEEED